MIIFVVYTRLNNYEHKYFVLLYLSRGEEMTNNPLSKYFRKPAIYIKLPTGGKFNPEMNTTILDEIGVLPMTAIDEITLRNPDSLLNGEALISLIASCCPDIPNPRNMCNIDAEALFLAIQYATYGSDLTHTHTCKKCNEKSDFNIDIDYMLNRFPEIEKIDPIEYDGLKINIKPPSVEAITRLSLIDLEQKRIIRSIHETYQDDSLGETEMAKRFYTSFRKIAEHNVELLANTISHIETPDGDISDYDSISEFLENIPTTVVDSINKSVEALSKKPDDVSTFEFICPECEEKDTVVLEVNPVNFFGNGSS